MHLTPILVAALTLTSVPQSPQPASGWRTEYERSGYVATGRYAEAVAYCNRLAAASPYAKVVSLGKSPQGRAIIALVLSREKAFTPEALRKSAKPLVAVNNGIHAGEIEGKDACLLLARDILITRREERLLDGVNLVLIPIFSVDAHERFGPYHRINQNGPQEMGWRATSTNLNLNRDFVKADAPEMRAMLRFLHAWKPDFFFDNHTTDGGDWQYAIQTGVATGPNVARPVAEWSRRMMARVQPQVEKDGFLMAPYFGRLNEANPGAGITVDEFSPRYSHAYLAALNRPAMLVETHMLKPYKTRVEATYSIVKRTIEECAGSARELKAAVAAADAADRGLAPGAAVVLTAKLSPESHPFVFRGFRYAPFRSEVSGALTPAWTKEPVDTPTRIQDTFVAGTTVEAPAAYAIPPQYTEAIERLELHGFQFARLKREMTGEFETTRFENVTFARTPFEGRFMPSFTAVKGMEKETLPAGTAIVPVSQPGARLLLHLLEPAGPDSLVRWGLFNTIFETKEYFENYSMEPIARKMLEASPALKTEFEEKLKDPAFAGSARARLEFFFQRSPYFDRNLNRYPVLRLNAAQLRDAGR